MSHEARRGFLGIVASLFQEKSSMVRPPYALDGETFSACQPCEGMCVNACEEKIIRREEGGTAYLDFSSSGCSDCQKCLEACVPDVLNDPGRFIQAKAHISRASCVSHHDTICFSCKEPCMENAIVFEGMFRPIVIPDKCTGCGYCVAVCPSAAIEMAA